MKAFAFMWPNGDLTVVLAKDKFSACVCVDDALADPYSAIDCWELQNGTMFDLTLCPTNYEPPEEGEFDEWWSFSATAGIYEDHARSESRTIRRRAGNAFPKLFPEAQSRWKDRLRQGEHQPSYLRQQMMDHVLALDLDEYEEREQRRIESEQRAWAARAVSPKPDRLEAIAYQMGSDFIVDAHMGTFDPDRVGSGNGQ